MHAASRKNEVTLTFTHRSVAETALPSLITTLTSCDDRKKKIDPIGSESYNGLPRRSEVVFTIVVSRLWNRLWRSIYH